MINLGRSNNRRVTIMNPRKKLSEIAKENNWEELPRQMHQPVQFKKGEITIIVCDHCGGSGFIRVHGFNILRGADAVKYLKEQPCSQ